MKIAMSSGHGKYIRGASGNPVPPQLDEVDQARRVVDRTAELLNAAGVQCVTFHDNTSHDQSTNLHTITNWHNKQTRDLDVSVHFNAYDGSAHGTECLYVTQETLAEKVSAALAGAGPFTNRGAKYRSDLYVLNNTNAPAILVETCFCDHTSDSKNFAANFEEICSALASAISGRGLEPLPPEPERPELPGGEVERRALSQGDSGEDVAELQVLLGVPADGEFGPVTDGAVKGFQAGWSLAVDGVVGPKTWEQLDVLEQRVRRDVAGLGDDEAKAIIAVAEHSPLADYAWRDRGVAPPGYLPGMMLSYGIALTLEESSLWRELSRRQTGKEDTDALAWYRDEIEALGWSAEISGTETLRCLWCLLIGLGMRESSGRYSEGVDQSASNHEADTAECGLFQTSWNINTASPEIPKLFDNYWANPMGFREDFAEGVSPKADELQNWGTGDGASHQWLSKYAPAYACLVTAVGLRKRRQHWGPINRKEVELVEEAAELCQQVEQIIDQGSVGY